MPPFSAAAVEESSVSPRAAEFIASVGAAPGGALEARLHARVDDLIGYQDEAYARDFVNAVARAAAAERTVAPGEERFATAVASGLYKLMAYKDEYEVARLHLDPAMRRRIEHEFGRGARTKLMFHPPVLRALGLKRKVPLGRRFTPTLVALRAGRRLRGTPIDPFGFAKVSRIERRLVADYRAAVDDAIETLSPQTLYCCRPRGLARPGAWV